MRKAAEIVHVATMDGRATARAVTSSGLTSAPREHPAASPLRAICMPWRAVRPQGRWRMRNGEDNLAAEPIILPGESLSKYRKGGEEARASHASEAPTVSLAPPANLYTVASGWDGGAVLPGETLSRRRPAETRNEKRSEPRREAEHLYGRDSRRDMRKDTPELPKAHLRGRSNCA